MLKNEYFLDSLKKKMTRLKESLLFFFTLDHIIHKVSYSKDEQERIYKYCGIDNFL